MTDLENKLLEGKYDAIMVPDFERFALERKGLVWKWAACSNAQIMMSENHPLAKKSSLTMGDIIYEEFVTLEHGKKGPIRRTWKNVFNHIMWNQRFAAVTKMLMRFSICSARTIRSF